MRKLFFKLALTFLFFSLNIEARPFAEEKAEIDAYSVTSHPDAVIKIYEYVMRVISGDDKGLYDLNVILPALKKLANQNYIVERSLKRRRDFHLVYGALILLSELAGRDTTTTSEVIEAGEIASILLSPQLFSLRFVSKDDSNVYKATLKHIQRFVLAGKYHLEVIQGDKLKNAIYARRSGNNPHAFLGKYFIPMIWLEEKAVYSEEAFIYALSKGLFLYGLDHRENDVHGGIYRYPAYLFIHDIGHYCELFRPALVSGELYEKVRKLYIELAGVLYRLVNNEHYFSKAQKPMAVRAAFLLLHENAFYLRLSDIAALEEGDIDSFYKLAVESFYETIQLRLGKLCDVKPLRLNGKRLAGSKRGLLPAEKDIRNGSDYAQMMAETYPDRGDELFGCLPEGSGERSLHYDGQLTLRLINNLISWFNMKLVD